jgi:hypothetical protein
MALIFFLVLGLAPLLLVTASGFFFIDPALFIFGNEPAALAHLAQDLAANYFLSKAA